MYSLFSSSANRYTICRSTISNFNTCKGRYYIPTESQMFKRCFQVNDVNLKILDKTETNNFVVLMILNDEDEILGIIHKS